MKNEVFITETASFFPNNPIDNNSIENYLGLISGQHSRVKNLVLRQNGIKNRYYALNTKQEMTHTNAELAANSINRLLSDKNLNEKSIELLSCATSNADQLMPSHASMVHGLLKNKPLEIFSASGICLSGIQALKIAYWAIKSGEKETPYAVLQSYHQQDYSLRITILNMNRVVNWGQAHIWHLKKTFCVSC